MTTRVIDTDAREERRARGGAAGSTPSPNRIDDDFDGRGGWDDDGDDDVIPPRPRGRLLRPLPLALIALIIAAAGFLGGIEAQKGSEGGSTAGGFPGGGSLPSFAKGAEGTRRKARKQAAKVGRRPTATGSEAAGLPSFGASEAAASGTVSSVEGQTIYVKESDGTTVAVKVGDGATVTRDSNVSAKKIHPGDTVTVEGSKHGSTVRASSISATESGVETTTAELRRAKRRRGRRRLGIRNLGRIPLRRMKGTKMKDDTRKDDGRAIGSGRLAALVLAGCGGGSGQLDDGIEHDREQLRKLRKHRSRRRQRRDVRNLRRSESLPEGKGRRTA